MDYKKILADIPIDIIAARCDLLKSDVEKILNGQLKPSKGAEKALNRLADRKQQQDDFRSQAVDYGSLKPGEQADFLV